MFGKINQKAGWDRWIEIALKIFHEQTLCLETAQRDRTCENEAHAISGN